MAIKAVTHARQEACVLPMNFLSLPRPLFKRHVLGTVPLETTQPLPSPVAGDLSECPDSGVAEEALQVAESVAVTTCTQQAKLPAVVSVKKSHRGCAVVILRDPEVIERCALQQVAVIDGVCVEMKRHCKKNKVYDGDGSAEPSEGIFCAWGNRVERKVPVSEEGIEEFFNSLAGMPCPRGLVARAPFEESHLCFPIVSHGAASIRVADKVDHPDAEKLLSSSHCDRASIHALWHAKGRVDDLWKRPPPPMARSVISRVARAQLFPHSGVGGEDHENRAGDKLAQLSAVVGLLGGVPRGSAFLDLCGGPGAWSQHLLGRNDLKLKGFGFTLLADSGAGGDWHADAKDEWYGDLYDHPDWTALWGRDETGDLLKSGNLEHTVRALAKENVFLVVADGGFSDNAIPPNQLELYFYRLFLAELLMAISCLKPGGKFVCKFYTAFSTASAALLFLTTRMFESVSVVKPMSSRATGPERYLSAVGFRGNEECAAIQVALLRSHNFGGGASPLALPLFTPMIGADYLMEDTAFTASMKRMVTSMCHRQAEALNAVVDRANFLEEVAMACSTCTHAFTRRAPASGDRIERNVKSFEGKGKAHHRGTVGRDNAAGSNLAMRSATWQ